MLIVCLDDDCVVSVEMLEADPDGWRCHCVQLQTSSPAKVQDEQSNFSPLSPLSPQCGRQVRGRSLLINSNVTVD